MERTSPNLAYSLEQTPPVHVTALLALQHAALALVFTVYPVLLASEIGCTREQSHMLVTGSLMAAAIGTLIQCLNRPRLGSGFLAVHIPSPIYIPVSILAGKAGGIGLLFGMTVFSGICCGLLSRVVHYLRTLLTVGVCGVSILMLGVSLIRPGIVRVTGIHGNVGSLPALTVSGITLASIIILSVWSGKRLRLYSVLIGLVIGYTAAFCCGLITAHDLRSAFSLAPVALPSVHILDLRFDVALLVPFLATALVSTLDAAAGVVTCQKINYVDWTKPDLDKVGRGVLANGVGTVCSGVFGGQGTDVSSTHIALTSATGATSRIIGVVAALMILAAAFFPAIPELLSMMPGPVVGAVLIYASAFLITTGIELIAMRMMDTRRVFAIGGAIIAGIAVVLFPTGTDSFPEWLRNILSSPFSVSTILVILLNLFFRIGASQSVRLSFAPRPQSIEEIRDFLFLQGGKWSARKEIVERAQMAAAQFAEAALMGRFTERDIALFVRFDEYNLDLEMEWEGKPLPQPRTAADPDSLAEDDSAFAGLSILVLKRLCDRFESSERDGKRVVRMHFDH
jgi:NCS2 family nucleobase:cation symporter-2